MRDQSGYRVAREGKSNSTALEGNHSENMNVLIAKLGATGDVVRTTPLLKQLGAEVTWLTAAKNTVFLENIAKDLRCFAWEQRDLARDRKYDLVINLEDTE